MFPSSFPRLPPARGQFPHSDVARNQALLPANCFIRHAVPPDGECLFRSIHMGLNQPGALAVNSDIMDLRLRFASYVRDNFQTLITLPSFGGVDGVTNLYEELLNPRGWNSDAGDLMVPLIAQVLGCEVIILQAQEDNLAYTLKQAFTPNSGHLPPGEYRADQAPIYLAHVAGGTHYDYLEPYNLPVNMHAQHQSASLNELTEGDLEFILY